MEALKTARSQLPSSLPQLPSLHTYSNFITTHQSSVTSIESALRSLTYVIPGRFRDAELASESLHSSVQLLSLYHDTILSRSTAKVSSTPIPGLQQQTSHNRYTKFWIQKSKFYRRVATLLAVVQYTELLWEMTAKRRGERIRWRVIIIIEIIKAVCKLLLLRITNSRPLVSPPLPEREVIPEETSTLSEEEEEELLVRSEFEDEGFHEEQHQRSIENAKRDIKKPYKMKRTGMSLPALPNSSDISNYLLSKVLTADDIKAPSTLLNRVQGPAHLAEYLHILHPLIYAIALSRSRNEKSNWQPWLLGLSIEYAARQLRKDGSGGLRSTALEREQWSKRGWGMGWWMMRGAFYENLTKGFLHRTSERLPALIGGVLEDYLYLWDGYYFSTSSN